MTSTHLVQFHPEMSVKKEKEEGLCGIGPCTPKCMQPLANIKSFVAFYAFNLLVTGSVGIFLDSQITSIERQFNLSSKESGIIASSNDIGFALTVLIFSFYGRRSHIPIILAIGTVLFGISGFIATIPYFLFPVEDIPDVLNSSGTFFGHEEICSRSNALSQNQSLQNGTVTGGLLQSNEMSNKPALLIICLAMVLQGIGKAPRTSLGGTYIDDSLEKTKVGLYMGLITGIGIFGPFFAFMLGARFSSMYVNLKKTDITPLDSRWIGAWWLGFLIIGMTAFISAVPMFFFPKRLKNRRVKLEEEKLENKGQYIKELLGLFWSLMKNPVYVLQVVRMVIETFLMAGTLPFVSKYFEVQYQIPAWKSNMLIGVFGILIAALGTILSGIITSKFKMTPLSCLKLTIVVSVIMCIYPIPGYMLGCEQPIIQKPGETSGIFATSPSNCSMSCFCRDDMFQPVCGADGNNYYSPCHAGCTGMSNGTYTDCNCVHNLTKTASPSYCASKCINLWPAVIVNLIVAFSDCLTYLPDYILLLRSVNEKEKPFALGLQSFLLSLLGFIPGPVVFGKIVDSTCLKWKSSTQEGGMCMLYDLHDFRLKYNLARFLVYVVVLMISFAIYYFARRRPDWQTNEDIPEIDFYPEEEKVFIKKNGNIEKKKEYHNQHHQRQPFASDCTSELH